MILEPDTPVKFTGNEGKAMFGHGRWPLPNGDQPGEYLKVTGTLRPCYHGLHYTTAGDALGWLGAEMYTFGVHPDAKINDSQSGDWNKFVTNQGRLLARVPTWNERTALLFCGEITAKVTQCYNEFFAEDTRIDDLLRLVRCSIRDTGGTKKAMYRKVIAVNGAIVYWWRMREIELGRLTDSERGRINVEYNRAFRVVQMLLTLSDPDRRVWWSLPGDFLDNYWIITARDRSLNLGAREVYRRWGTRLVEYLNESVDLSGY